MCNCKNVGPFDRMARITLGLAAIILAFTLLDVGSGSTAGIAAMGFGVVMLVTAAAGICPLYLPFKVRTCKV